MNMNHNPIMQVLYKIHHIPRAHPPHKLFGPCPLEPKEIDGQLVSPEKAYTLLTNHLVHFETINFSNF